MASDDSICLDKPGVGIYALCSWINADNCKGRSTPYFFPLHEQIISGARDFATGGKMSSSHKIKKNGFIWGAVFLAFVLLMPTPAGSEENRSLLKKGSTRNSQAPELEPVTENGSFFGLKIPCQLQGGGTTFSGGALKKA